MSHKITIRKVLTNNIVSIAQALTAVSCPGEVITANMANAGVIVKSGNILKVHVAVNTYMAFGHDATIEAVSVTTSPALLLTPGEHYVVCLGDYVRCSTNPTRVELLDI